MASTPIIQTNDKIQNLLADLFQTCVKSRKTPSVWIDPTFENGKLKSIKVTICASCGSIYHPDGNTICQHPALCYHEYKPADPTNKTDVVAPVIVKTEESLDDLLAPVNRPSAIQTPENTGASKPGYEGFLSIALRCIARGQRPLPIIVGAKNPAIKWKDTVIDTASTEAWGKLARPWVDEYAANFPDAAVCVIAKPNEFLFIDEDESESFRSGYEAWSGEKYPSTFTTESRPDHRLSHWLQTDKTRAMGNISQRLLGVLSVRQNNLYVLAEGSPHPTGGFYRTIDSTPAIPMPDKLVEYILSLKAQYKPKKETAPETSVEITSSNPTDIIDPAPRLDDGIKIEWGGQNDAVSRFAYREWVLRLHSEDDVRRNVHEYNQTHCTPPMPDGEVETIVNYKLRLKQIGCGVMIGGILHPICEAREEEPTTTDDSFQQKINKLLSEGKNAHEIAELTGFNQLVKETLEKTASETIKVEQTTKNEITQGMIDKNFPAYDGKAPEQPRMLIDNFLMGGVNFFGSLSGVGKSWVALAVAKALTTKEPLFGFYPIKEIVPTLYLIPETDESGFKYRMGVIGMTQNPELFRYRTITQGQTLSLTDPLTLAVIKYLHHDGRYPHVLVVVDTAVRFMASGSDEKSATDNTLSNEADKLRSPEVAADLLFLHHSPKASARLEMTLENVLRGTGDFGAMADCVFGLQRDEGLFDYGGGPEELDIKTVKTRAPETPKPFRVRLKRAPKEGEGDRTISVIKELGTLQYIGDEEVGISLAVKFAMAVAGNSAISLRALKSELHISHEKIKKLAKDQGWKQALRPVSDPKTGETKKVFIWTNVGLASDAADSTEPDDVIDFSSQEPSKSGKDGRPATGEQPMTGAERIANHRKRKKEQN